MRIQADRMQGLASAIFTQVDDMRKTEEAAGRDIITLSIGSPDMAPAPHIIDTLIEASRDITNYGYTLSRGTSDFLRAVANWYQEKFGVVLNPETEIHSLMGSQDGLAHLGLCVVNPGDIVLVPDPGYPIFSAGPLVAGAELYRMPLKRENGYLPDLDAIDESVLCRAKFMIINYPNNPLAAVAPREFFAKVVALAHKYQFLVVHDFAYSELVFDGYRPDSFLSVPGAKDIGIEMHSLSKTYNMAGCRVAFAVGNAEVIAMLGRLKSNFDYGVFYPIQKAAVAALSGPQDCVRETAAAYQRRRDIIVDGFNEMGWKVDKPLASMYIWAPVPTKQTSFEFITDLIKRAGVAVVPGVAFGEHGEGYIRIALVQPENRLKEAVERIKKCLG
ncbi:MAG: LL-diaminopimelate aminotransferase [Negativicutes bacterium]|nr:LL-diaminopimelate aminotransferase [Negativicutes bacterium]